MKDFFKREFKPGNFFIQANHAGRSSAILLVGQVLGFKKDRMYYTRCYMDSSHMIPNCYTTRLDACVIISEDLLPSGTVFALEQLYVQHKQNYV